jgi:hypothetical protein
MSRIFGNRAEEGAGGRWAARLTTWLVAVAALLMASAIPLGGGPPSERDKAKVAEVAPAAYDAAPDVACVEDARDEGAAADEQPSFLARFFKQLRTAAGAAMIGLAVALGQPPEEPIPDRYGGPRELAPAEDVGDYPSSVDVDDGEPG